MIPKFCRFWGRKIVFLWVLMMLENHLDVFHIFWGWKISKMYWETIENTGRKTGEVHYIFKNSSTLFMSFFTSRKLEWCKRRNRWTIPSWSICKRQNYTLSMECFIRLLLHYHQKCFKKIYNRRTNADLLNRVL